MSVQIQELQSGAPGAWVALPYRVGGWIIADQVARVLTNGDTTLWDEEAMAYVLTADNVGDIDPDAIEFPEGYQDQFKELWGK